MKQLPTLRDLIVAVHDASCFMVDNRDKASLATQKADGTYVTEVDLLIHRQLRSWAQQCGLGYIGEEGNRFNGEPYVLYVDPLDGTHAYMAGRQDATCVASIMALNENGTHGEPYMAIIYNPFRKQTWAVQKKSNGVWFINSHCQVFDNRHVRLAPMALPLNVSVATWNGVPHNLAAVCDRVRTDKRFSHRVCYSTAQNLCHIFDGALHADVFGGTSAVETAAKALLMQTAGGVVSDLYGNRIDSFQLAMRDGKLDFLLPNGALMSGHQDIHAILLDVVASANH